jgi:hypothetical protein
MSGDDVSVKHRVSTICREFAAHPECMLVCSSTLRIDDAGKTLARNNTRPQNGTFKSTRLYHEIYGGAPVCGATAAYRVPLRDLFPPMGKGPHAEDNCFWFRARLIGDIHYIAEPLVHWRVHSSNQSNWERDMDTIIARKKHLKFLKSHQCMAPQWTSDLSHALNAGMITTHIYETLKRTIDLKRETSRLIRFSIESVPWSIWLGSACRFLRVSARSGTFQKSLRKVRKRYLPLRLFRCRRQKYWNSYFDGMRP